jgi:succinate-semialdehyde dehydrogenase/glutarate-semialdehyde dehydrogenase
MEHFTTENPATGERLAEYRYLDDGALRQALRESAAAFAAWRREPLEKRLAPLARLGELLKADAERLGRLAVAEMGKPLTQAIKEVEKCATACAYYVDNAARILADEPVDAGLRKSYVAHEPLGPVLSVMPWNFPYWQVLRFAAPALAAGNTIVLKHADNTTGCSLALGELFRRAGFPAGTFQALVIDHDGVKRAIEDDAIRAVTLTGSERAGKSVASTAGGVLKKAVLELGGSDAYLVLRDADVEKAAAACVAARLVNSGQSCVAAKRFIVASEIYDAFTEAFVAAARKAVVGDPLDAKTDVGPLAKPAIRDEVARQVRASVAQGAKPLLGGEPRDGRGNFYPVTVLGDVRPGMPAFDEEVFGPAAALIRADSEDDAVALANQSRYGLGGAVFSRDVARAEHIAARRLEAGICAVNGQVASDARLPFGGVKSSGYGRELGKVGIMEFVNVKTVAIH